MYAVEIAHDDQNGCAILDGERVAIAVYGPLPVGREQDWLDDFPEGELIELAAYPHTELAGVLSELAVLDPDRCIWVNDPLTYSDGGSPRLYLAPHQEGTAMPLRPGVACDSFDPADYETSEAEEIAKYGDLRCVCNHLLAEHT